MLMSGSLGQRWDVNHSPFMRAPAANSPYSVTAPLRMAKRQTAKKQFIAWVGRKHPALLKQAKAEASTMSALPYRYNQDMNVRMRYMTGLGQETTPGIVEQPQTKSWWESALDTVIGTVQQVAPVYIGIQTQKDLMDINIERMKQGLPPIEDASKLAPTLNVSVSPETVKTATSSIGTQMLIPLAILGFGLLVLMGRKRR